MFNTCTLHQYCHLKKDFVNNFFFLRNHQTRKKNQIQILSFIIFLNSNNRTAKHSYCLFVLQVAFESHLKINFGTCTELLYIFTLIPVVLIELQIDIDVETEIFCLKNDSDIEVDNSSKGDYFHQKKI